MINLFRPSAVSLCRFLAVAGLSIVLCCAFSRSVGLFEDSDADVTSSVRNIKTSMLLPKGGGFYRIGDPYVVGGRTYTPQRDTSYRAEGIASWYGGKFHGRLTANGEVYDMNALSAAHPTLPIPSYVRVTNLDNRRSIIVRLNDRGPFHDDRLIDVSVRAAQLLGFYDRGLAQVRVDYIGPAELAGSDDKMLAATLRHHDVAMLEAPDETASVDMDPGPKTDAAFPNVIYD